MCKIKGSIYRKRVKGSRLAISYPHFTSQQSLIAGLIVRLELLFPAHCRNWGKEIIKEMGSGERENNILT